ncbi:uncharacterized protein LOC108485304 [Gossypium arboreum]|uniref:uncharacterized protein LOC108485304 n=1 Tax=Gossypium arboreum TaxID=29729 RepID=UPI0008191F30|nr:uncharacterized protein LOC108485304 [Gossypium arboreum]
MKAVTSLDGYLILPILIGKKKLAASQRILDSATNRIGSWYKRLLSNGGKEIFIKSIFQSIPTYAFSIFFVPNGVMEELQDGGLRFRDLRLFNMALLGRQVWRLISCKDTLCFRVLSAKYFPDRDVFHPKHIDKPTFTWQSIAKAARFLYEGSSWNVGRGSKIDIWHDNWGFEGISSDSIGLNKREVQEEKVSDLLNNETDGWNE